MRGPTLAELMQARASGGYAASTPAPFGAQMTDRERASVGRQPTDEEIAIMEAEMQSTGAPPRQPVQLPLTQQPTPDQREALWGRGAPVGQTVSPDVFGAPPPQRGPAAMARDVAAPAVALASPQAAPMTQDEVLQGLMLKARDADPASKTYRRLPDAVAQNYGIEGIDEAQLSIAERLALRRMGVKFGAPKRAPRLGAPQRNGPPPLDYTKYLRTGAAGSRPAPSGVYGDKVWLHAQDIPSEWREGVPSGIPVYGADIPLSDLDPAQADEIIRKIQQQRR
jgi:hypothetical protein